MSKPDMRLKMTFHCHRKMQPNGKFVGTAKASIGGIPARAWKYRKNIVVIGDVSDAGKRIEASCRTSDGETLCVFTTTT